MFSFKKLRRSNLVLLHVQLFRKIVVFLFLLFESRITSHAYFSLLESFERFKFRETWTRAHGTWPILGAFSSHVGFKQIQLQI